MPHAPRQRPRHPLPDRGRRTAAGPAPRRDLDALPRTGPPSARCSGRPSSSTWSTRAVMAGTRWDAADGLAREAAGGRPAGLRRRARPGHVPPRWLLHGRDDGAHVRDALPGAACGRPSWPASTSSASHGRASPGGSWTPSGSSARSRPGRPSSSGATGRSRDPAHGSG